MTKDGQTTQPKRKHTPKPKNAKLRCKSYKFRLYPTRKQIRTLEWTLWLATKNSNHLEQEVSHASRGGYVPPLGLRRSLCLLSVGYFTVILVDTNELSDAFLYVGGMTCNAAKLVNQFYLTTLVFVGTAGEQ